MTPSFPVANLGPAIVSPQCPHAFHGVIFDFDGTLADSTEYWESVGGRFLNHRGFQVDEYVQTRFREMTIAQSADLMREYYGISESREDIIAEVMDYMDQDYRNHVQLKPGALETLSTLHEAGIPLCIATAAERSSVSHMLEKFDIAKLFTHVLYCSEVGASKTQPAVFLEAARRLGLTPNHILVIEDSIHAIHTAKRAGFIVAGIKDPANQSVRDQVIQHSDLYLESLCGTTRQ